MIHPNYVKCTSENTKIKLRKKLHAKFLGIEERLLRILERLQGKKRSWFGAASKTSFNTIESKLNFWPTANDPIISISTAVGYFSTVAFDCSPDHRTQIYRLTIKISFQQPVSVYICYHVKSKLKLDQRPQFKVLSWDRPSSGFTYFFASKFRPQGKSSIRRVFQ